MARMGGPAGKGRQATGYFVFKSRMGWRYIGHEGSRPPGTNLAGNDKHPKRTKEVTDLYMTHGSLPFRTLRLQNERGFVPSALASMLLIRHAEYKIKDCKSGPEMWILVRSFCDEGFLSGLK